MLFAASEPPDWLVQDVPLGVQVLLLFVLPIPLFTFGWTLAKEQVVSECRQWCQSQCQNERLPWIARKLLYMPTCEFCASAWVGLALMVCIRVRLFVDAWIVGFIFTWGCLVGVAWLYISLFSQIRTDIRRDKAVVEKEQAVADAVRDQPNHDH